MVIVFSDNIGKYCVKGGRIGEWLEFFKCDINNKVFDKRLEEED